MATTRDEASEAVLRRLRDLHGNGRPSWTNFDTLTSGAQYRRLHRLCREFIPSGARVLDWGSGTGHASIYLTTAGFDATGFSMDPFSFEDLVAGGRYRFVAGKPAEPVLLPFRNAEFDAVLSVGVLEHVRETGGDERGSLREIERILRPGGVFLCFHFPNEWSWIEAIARRLDAHSHPYRYTPSDVRRLFEGAGFRIERRERYGLLPRNQVARFLPRRLCDMDNFSRFYDALDGLGAALLPWITQNHLVVARKPA